jgi:hypothetical protein
MFSRNGAVMSETLKTVTKKKPDPTAEQAAEELVRPARQQGLSLTGPDGSRGCVRLMADPELATATGGYYSSAKLKKSSKKSQDAEGQERIYAQTERELRAHP